MLTSLGPLGSDWEGHTAPALRHAVSWSRTVKKPSRVKLKLMTGEHFVDALSAPPVLRASDHSVDYVCGRCETVLLHAEQNQIHGVVIRCTTCGAYNSTDP
jgi:DNA-directed RNA polymerase subunit RPC12/RpoP